jgi:aminopeptidase-like protein
VSSHITSRALCPDAVGEDMYRLAGELYPICRSITGDGVRATLGHVKRHIDLTIHEVPTGTRVFDWVIPEEWNITDAYIKNLAGERLVDFKASNLHVVGYSAPVHEIMPLSDLKQHLFTLPEQPDLIPYRTSYYNKTWGFCLTQRQLDSLRDERYEVCIDSRFKEGHLTYGEYVIEGQSRDEVLISTHVCHPSLANDNLSGIALATFLAKRLTGIGLKYTYRFLFIPGTIGSIAWLSRNEDELRHIKHGLVLSCVGDGGGPTYKRSRRGNAGIDRTVEHVLRECGNSAVVDDFSPYGYDERQYCSPAFDLPVGLFERSQYGKFPEYHTSADNMGFIKPEWLEESYRLIARVIEVLENDALYANMNPKCEPQLGRRGLYSAIGGDKDAARRQMAMLWVLNLSDGKHSLLDIAERARIPFGTILETAKLLEDRGLLARAG